MKTTNPTTPQQPNSMFLVLSKDAPLKGDIELDGIPEFPIPTPTEMLDEYKQKLSEGYSFRLKSQVLPPLQQARHPPQALNVLRPRAASLGEQLAAMRSCPPSSQASKPPAALLAKKSDRAGSVQRRPAAEPVKAASVKRARTEAQSDMSAELSATIALVLLAQQAPSRGKGSS